MQIGILSIVIQLCVQNDSEIYLKILEFIQKYPPIYL